MKNAKNAKEPTLKDLLKDSENLLKNFEKLQKGEIELNELKKIEENSNDFFEKYEKYLPKDDLGSKK